MNLKKLLKEVEEKQLNEDLGNIALLAGGLLAWWGMTGAKIPKKSDLTLDSIKKRLKANFDDFMYDGSYADALRNPEEFLNNQPESKDKDALKAALEKGDKEAMEKIIASMIR